MQLNVSHRNNSYNAFGNANGSWGTNLALFLNTHKVVSPRVGHGLILCCEVLRRGVKLVNGIVFWWDVSLKFFSQMCLASLIKKNAFFFLSSILISLNWSLCLKAVRTIENASTCGSIFEIHVGQTYLLINGFSSFSLMKNYTKHSTDCLESLLTLE